MNYNDYFPIDFDCPDNNDMMDMMLFDYTRTDFDTSGKTPESIKYLRDSKAFLTNELYVCYEFMKEKGLLKEYQHYRNGK